MATTGHIYLGDDGQELKLDTNISDLSGASDPRVYYQKPDGTEGYWTANISGQYLIYALQSSVLDQIGVWKLQAYINKNGPIRGDTVYLKVLALFAKA